MKRPTSVGGVNSGARWRICYRTLLRAYSWVSSRNLPSSTACKLATPGCGTLDLILETELAGNTRPHRLFVSSSMELPPKVLCFQVFGFTSVLELSHESAKLCRGRDFFLRLLRSTKDELPHFTCWIVADPLNTPRHLLKVLGMIMGRRRKHYRPTWAYGNCAMPVPHLWAWLVKIPVYTDTDIFYCTTATAHVVVA